MSLKVNKGQKITAIHSNKIVDAICKIGANQVDYQLKSGGLFQACVQIPAFSLCWYQYNDDSLVVYTNTQGDPDKILFLNNEPVPYCSFGYQLPTNACGAPPTEKIEGDGVRNASYLAVMTIDSACAVDPTVILVREKPLHAEDGTTSNCSDGGTPQLLTEGETPTEGEGEEGEEEPKILYTFSSFECVQGVWPCAELIGEYPIGKYSNFGIKQVQHGLIIASDTDYVWADSDISSLQISSMQLSVYEDVETKELSTYVQLFDAQKGFEEPIPRRHDFLDGLPQCMGLRTVFLYCGQYGTSLSGGDSVNCEEIDTTQGTFVRYGAAEEFYILNDHDGIEPYNFVTPKHIATYEHITIGCTGVSPCDDVPSTLSEGDTTTEGDGCGGTGDMATIYFSNPLVIDFKESSSDGPSYDDCSSGGSSGDGSTGDGSTGEGADEEGLTNGLSGNIISGDLIFTVCDNGNGAPMHGDWEGQFKTFIPTTVSAGEYVDVLEWKNVFTVYGPEIFLKYVDLSNCADSSESGVYSPSAIFVETTSTDLSITPLHWDLYIDRPISAECYLKLSNNVLCGPEIVLSDLSGINGDIKYEFESHKWYLGLTSISEGISSLSTTTLSAGDYIKLTENETTHVIDGFEYITTEYKVDGPSIDISFYSVCDDNPTPPTRSSSSPSTPEDPGGTNNEIYFRAPTATYIEPEHKWDIKIAPPQPLSDLSAELSDVIGGDSHCLSAGQYIKIDESFNPLLTYTVNGPEMALSISNTQNCDSIKNPISGDFTYNSDDNKWDLNLLVDISAMTGDGISTKLSAGDYIHIDESTTGEGNPLYTINGPEMCVKVSNTAECDTLNTITASFDYANDVWTLNLKTATGGGSDLSAGDYITIEENKINGAGITIACTDTVKGTANYNNGSWELSLDATVDLEDIEIPNGVCVVAGNNATVNHTTANDVDTYTVIGPGFSIGTVKGIDASITQNGIDYVLNLCASTGTTYNAGNYITIDGNNNINGSGIVIGTTKGITASATHANNNWTLNLEADPPKAGNYITVGTDGSVNGAAMAIGKSVGIDAGFTYSNGTWTLDLCTSGGGVPSVNGIEDAVTITSTSLNVTTSGNTITIEDPNGPNVVYTFDPEWFCVSGTNVTINSAKVEAIGEEIAICAASSINTTTTTVIDNTDYRGTPMNIVATITNTDALNARASIVGVNA